MISPTSRLFPRRRAAMGGLPRRSPGCRGRGPGCGRRDARSLLRSRGRRIRAPRRSSRRPAAATAAPRRGARRLPRRGRRLCRRCRGGGCRDERTAGDGRAGHGDPLPVGRAAAIRVRAARAARPLRARLHARRSRARGPRLCRCVGGRCVSSPPGVHRRPAPPPPLRADQRSFAFAPTAHNLDLLSRTPLTLTVWDDSGAPQGRATPQAQAAGGHHHGGAVLGVASVSLAAVAEGGSLDSSFELRPPPGSAATGGGSAGRMCVGGRKEVRMLPPMRSSRGDVVAVAARPRFSAHPLPAPLPLCSPAALSASRGPARSCLRTARRQTRSRAHRQAPGVTGGGGRSFTYQSPPPTPIPAGARARGALRRRRRRRQAAPALRGADPTPLRRGGARSPPRGLR